MENIYFIIILAIIILLLCQRKKEAMCSCQKLDYYGYRQCEDWVETVRRKGYMMR